MYRVSVGYRFSCVFYSWEEASRFMHTVINSMEEAEDIKVELVKHNIDEEEEK